MIISTGQEYVLVFIPLFLNMKKIALIFVLFFLASCKKDDCKGKEYWNGRCWNVYTVNDSLILCIPQFEGATPKFLTISKMEMVADSID